jgi:hypothetical protein
MAQKKQEHTGRYVLKHMLESTQKNEAKTSKIKSFG